MNTYQTADIVVAFDREEHRLRVFCATDPLAYREVKKPIIPGSTSLLYDGRELTVEGAAADVLADRYAFALKKLCKLEDKEMRSLKLDNAELETLETLLADSQVDEESDDEAPESGRGNCGRTRAFHDHK